MFKTWWISYQLRTTYFVNSLIYSLKQFPFFGKFLPSTLYKSKSIKIICQVIGFVKELVSIFFGKFIYIFLITLVLSGLKVGQANGFVHLFFFLTLVGAFLNTSLFDPTRDKYYAIYLLKMDAKSYVLTDYIYFLCKTFVGFVPFIVLFGLPLKVPQLICFLLPVLVLAVKNIKNANHLYFSTKKKKVQNENQLNVVTLTAVFVFLALAFLPPYFGYALTPLFVGGLTIFFFLVSLLAFYYLVSYNKYYSTYKAMYQNYQLVLNNQNTSSIQQQMYQQGITYDLKDESKKTGYAYFHDLFLKRHQKVLTKATKKISLVVVILFLFCLFLVLQNTEIKERMNRILLIYVPYFLIVMYAINRGQPITQAMFMNCDHSMLTYNFYREPGSILQLFKERLKSLILINLLPAVIIGFALVILLAVSGGVPTPLYYVILFVTIIMMSIFFSVHHLVIYYLLQPYNVALEMKSSSYQLVNTVTYLVCYFTFQLKIPLFTYGLIVIIFTVCYSLIALYLAYTRAPKTFKLRL